MKSEMERGDELFSKLVSQFDSKKLEEFDKKAKELGFADIHEIWALGDLEVFIKIIVYTDERLREDISKGQLHTILVSNNNYSFPYNPVDYIFPSLSEKEKIDFICRK